MPDLNRRLISFAGSTVAVEYQGRRAEAIVDYVFRYVGTAGGPEPHRTLCLISDDAGGELRLCESDDAEPRRTASDGWMAEYLLGRTCYHLADQSRGGLLFHAAGLSWGELGMILPGRIGAGKTTLAAWLLTQGFRYLTDELVYVPQGDDTFQAFIRPLNVKPVARPLLRRLFHAVGCDQAGSGHPGQRAASGQPRPSQDGLVLSGPTGDLVSPELLSPHRPFSEAGLRLIVFPRYRPDCRLDVTRLTRARAGLALMECLINARNLPQYGFDEAVRLARTVPAYRLAYSDFAQLEDVFSEMGAGELCR
jgi:hypothetical protein